MQSGYRNRLLPLPINHRQPRAHGVDELESSDRYVTEPAWTQFLPLSPRTQYLLFWYIAETLPPEAESALNACTPALGSSRPPYQQPPAYPSALRLADRVKDEPADYVPPKHEGTGVDEEEMLYESHLLGINDAIAKLGRSVMAEVVKEGWEAIQQRLSEEQSLDGGQQANG